LPVNSTVILGIYDILGREVSKLVNEEQEAGSHTVKFNAGNLSSGVYICRIIAADFVKTIKMILMK
ncbi:MAG: T9SS type A sorting domain-containing protein, partial [Ignavibacteriaceae bacterium]|nr:T9SS type A sorting domain-containing protein [Ignavibacteriaceae bacterium]